AADAVPVDWQVQLAPGSDVAAAAQAVGVASRFTALEVVGYADHARLSAHPPRGVQHTRPRQVLRLGPGYRAALPAEVRPLIGAQDGVLVAQQAAANLAISVGDTLTVQRVGLPPVDVRVDGIVDLPNADSLFQAVGVAPGAAPQAPPDEVLL